LSRSLSELANHYILSDLDVLDEKAQRGSVEWVRDFPTKGTFISIRWGGSYSSLHRKEDTSGFFLTGPAERRVRAMIRAKGEHDADQLRLGKINWPDYKKKIADTVEALASPKVHVATTAVQHFSYDDKTILCGAKVRSVIMDSTRSVALVTCADCISLLAEREKNIRANSDMPMHYITHLGSCLPSCGITGATKMTTMKELVTCTSCKTSAAFVGSSVDPVHFLLGSGTACGRPDASRLVSYEGGVTCTACRAAMAAHRKGDFSKGVCGGLGRNAAGRP
jgi:hypothetical protein